MINFIDEINKIKQKSTFNTKRLYLIALLKEDTGFFLNGDKLVFAVKYNGDAKESISTKYLILETDICIGSIENYPSFKTGYYNLLSYNYVVDDQYLDSFVELCKNYSSLDSNFKFVDFFYSLLKLFEPVKETSFINCVGLFGELVIIKRMFLSYDIDISKEWHNALGALDKYDFSFKNFNLEVKSTVKKSNIFTLKHNQVFNGSTNYISIINLELDNSGETLSDLYSFFKTTSVFNKNIDFMIKLEKEKRRIDPNDFEIKKISISKIRFFCSKDLKTISNIPDCIEQITYNYDFTNKEFLDIKEFSDFFIDK